MPICKELLAPPHGSCSFMVKTTESSKTHQTATKGSICDGAYYNHVLAWLFRNEDPTVDSCKATFKREMALVIHRSKKKYAPAMEQWLHDFS
jgi:hypothetical protein